MGREAELIEAARGGNYPQVERILSTKPKKAGPFASLRRAQVILDIRLLSVFKFRFSSENLFLIFFQVNFKISLLYFLMVCCHSRNCLFINLLIGFKELKMIYGNI